MRLLTLALVGLLAVGAAAPAGAAPAASGTADAAASAPVSLTVAVETAAGAGVGGATIEATWDGGQTTARTASNGKAFVDVPMGADVTLRVDHPDYVRNHPVRVDDASAREVRVEVARKGSAMLRVTDSDGPVAGVAVDVRRDGRTVVSGTTDDRGVVTTGTVERGDYDLSLSKPGYYDNRTTLSVTGDVQRELEVRRGSVTLAVRVEDDHFDPARPVQNATVTVADLGSARTTDGRATFAVPVNTWVEVSATKDGYRTATRKLRMGESDHQVRLSVRRERALVVEPANRRVVVGEGTVVTVVDAYGAPVEGAEVLVGEDVAGTTGSDGTLRVTVERAGNVSLRARADGVTSEGATVEGVSGDVVVETPTQTSPPTETPPPTTTTAVDLPGFTALAGLLSVLLGALALRRRD